MSDDSELCQQLLAFITLVYRPVTLAELTALSPELEDIANEPDSIREVIGHCRSFLTLRQGTIYFVHQSAKDFLLARAAKELFPSGKNEIHHLLAIRSLEILSRTLRRDMYDLKLLGHLSEDIKQPNPDPLAASCYPCIYWVDHLYSSDPVSSALRLNDLQDGGTVHEFLRAKYIYWLEALSLCKSMSKGVISVSKLQSLIQVSTIEHSLKVYYRLTTV